MYVSRNKRKVHFEIVDNVPVSLLSGAVSEALNLVKFNTHLVYQVDTKQSDIKFITKDDVYSEYEDVFTGLGKLPGKIILK